MRATRRTASAYAAARETGPSGSAPKADGIPHSTTSGRRALTIGTAALVAGATLALAPAITAGSADAAFAADGTTFNPFDNAGGFSLYARGDANLQHSEVEGAIAVGGTLTAKQPGGRLPIQHYVTGTADYTAPVIDGAATRVLIGAYSDQSGILDVSGSGIAPNDGYAKLAGGEQAPFFFAYRGGYAQYVVPGGEDQGPSIDAKNQAWDAADPGATFRTAETSVAAYVEQGDAWDQVDGWLAPLADPAAGLANRVEVAHDTDRAVLALQAGVVNVIDYADLFLPGGAYPTAVTYAGPLPAADTPLIIRVPAGTTSVIGMALDGGAGTDAVANSIMWDLSALSGPVTMAPNTGNGQLDGSVYAPHADLTLTFGPLGGQVIAETLTTTGDSGETHAYYFRAELPTVVVTPTGPTTPTEPTAPTEPITPAEPTTPTEPTAPTTPTEQPVVNPVTEQPQPQPEQEPQPQPTPSATPTTPAPAPAGGDLSPTGSDTEALPSTGVDPALPLGIAVGAVTLGALGLLLALRRPAARR
ncbi:collagen-binding domain-containing protein [Agromyces sp. MMS24-JH15]|uniref:collagen-binding domain-containing protein n=1 Tax=Agromyces sp. MMS24-JH15 TaxID=3243765 RepID=UPI0037483414